MGEMLTTVLVLQTRTDVHVGLQPLVPDVVALLARPAHHNLPRCLEYQSSGGGERPGRNRAWT